MAVSASGEVLGAMYTQRVASYERLWSTTRESELELHTASGPVVQLLGVVQRADAAVGDLLRNYVLLLGRLDATVEMACGVTRCRNYDPSSGTSYAAYAAHVAEGTDPGLLFHSSAGARIGELVAGYRPRDVASLGYGVMICYELGAGGRGGSGGSGAAGAARAGGGAPSGAGAPCGGPARVESVSGVTSLISATRSRASCRSSAGGAAASGASRSCSSGWTRSTCACSCRT